ncbi:hypothetical protein ACTXPA_13505 [Glutamicibacter arilaitensis]|uniref:hypothetical protein n=1 Tax=Glutamicibacter arilaitensis TaxID=256701 RepID=UPI003FD2C621
MSKDLGQTNGFSRRTIVKGAAWSVPVVATAVAAPLAAASVNNATLAFTNSSSSLLGLTLLDGNGLITANVLVTVPTELTLDNGPGELSGIAQVTVTVGRPSGINIPIGRARGFGVASFDNINSLPTERTVTYREVLGTKYGIPTTTFTSTRNISVASNGSLVLPIVFGLAGDSTGVSIGLLSTFPVVIELTIGGRTFTANSTISVPVAAGIL